MTVRRRDGDAADPEAWRGRRLHSLSREEVEHFVAQLEGENVGSGSALSISWGRATLAAKGVAAIVLLMWVTVVLAQLYSGWRVERAIEAIHNAAASDHRALRTSQDRTSCGLMMTPSERTQFREEYKPGAWERWCPWMSNER